MSPPRVTETPTGPELITGAPAEGDASAAAQGAGALVRRALGWAAERAGEAAGRNGEPFVDHARATIGILRELGADETVQAAAALIAPPELLPIAEIEAGFGADVARLVDGMRQIRRLRELVAAPAGAAAREQQETLRRMVLAMASDIRVVILRLASRLQTLRHHAATKRPPDPGIARETLDVLAPLANRLGLWQLKWELEDLAFRFVDPERYKALARQLEEKRAEREAFVEATIARLRGELAAAGIRAEVSGRPKHIWSIHNKMLAKARPLEEIQDLRGLRVIVDTVDQCYAALGVIHGLWPAMTSEFDDYIARPKPNGYRSLHTVVTADDGRPLEVQIRTQEMHRFAEYGVASHWRYKERTTGVAPKGAGKPEAGFDDAIAWMRQLLAWQREMGQSLGSGQVSLAGAEERIYVLTPQARVVELPAGATPVDFAYHVHTSLGHRCRGARVDGQMVPLNTPLQNGQTVEIVAAKDTGAEGPSRDWLNPQAGYLKSARSLAKVRQWFNARELERDLAAGREKVARVLQREGKTALSFDELARRLGFTDPAALFVAVAREELVGPRALEEAVRGAPAAGAVAQTEEEQIVSKPSAGGAQRGGVLVVGVDSLMTQLAKCCRPVPPDEIVGFVTRGRGVSVHRKGCETFARLSASAPERVLETQWGANALRGGERGGRFPAEVEIRASDRQGLLRDISEVFSRDRLNVIAVQTLTRNQVAQMRFTVEVPDARALQRTLESMNSVAGVVSARRR